MRFATPAVGFEAQGFGKAGAAQLFGGSLPAEEGAFGMVEAALEERHALVLLFAPMDGVTVFDEERGGDFVVTVRFPAQEPIGFGGALDGLVVSAVFGW